MNGFRLLLLLGLILTSFFGLSQGVVYIEDNKFKLDGEDYYPMVMNFGTSIIRDGNGDLFVAPKLIYGEEHIKSDCAGNLPTCVEELREEFELIKKMGFNVVRLTGGIVPFFSEDGGGNPNFSLISVDDVDNLFLTSNQNEWLLAPYAMDSNFEQYLSMVKDVLDLLAELEMKAIIVTSNSFQANPSTQYVTRNSSNLAIYNAFLDAIRVGLSQHEAIFAFDLVNEPQYKHLHFKEGDAKNKYSKAEICEIVKEWYRSISGEDHFHLVTIGGGGLGELAFWDFSVMDLDFYSTHVYPKPLKGDNFNRSKAWDRALDQLVWMSNFIEKPIIIGETGYSSVSDLTSYSPPSDLFNSSQYGTTYIWGEDVDQKRFAEESLRLSRDCGYTGYSWWIYGNSRDLDNPQNIHYGVNFEGVMDYGRVPKEIIAGFDIGGGVFNEFINSQEEPDPSQCLYSSDYLNGFGFDKYAIGGVVKDGNGNPLRNVYVYGSLIYISSSAPDFEEFAVSQMRTGFLKYLAPLIRRIMVK